MTRLCQTSVLMPAFALSVPLLLIFLSITPAIGATIEETVVSSNANASQTASRSPDETDEQPAKKFDFALEIRPILSDKCFFCHGPDDSHREADLRLDVAEEAFADRGGYSAIVPGDADDSEVWYRISPDADESMVMPPIESGKSLTEDERELLRQWIEAGANWSDHWAYVPPRQHELPSSDDASNDETSTENLSETIDRWIGHRLAKKGLTASPRADKLTLARRLSFDLTGLPPEPSMLERFLNDDDPAAYEKLVDELLASPHFGERMAIYWLDLVRFADTVGYHGDQDHNITPYRDYVIDAYNLDLPFDQFTREQLAGDLVEGANTDTLIASGYNRLLQTTHEGGLQPKEYLAIYAADRVRNVSEVWMGATVGCAQCHNHKYDPYTIEDHYALASFFADVDEARHFKEGSNAVPTRRPPEIKVLVRSEREEVAELSASIDEAKQELDKVDDTSSQHAEKLSAVIAELEEHKKAIEDAARMTMITKSIEPRTMRVLPRGNWLDDSGKVVEPKAPGFLPPLNVSNRRATRLDLANWLTDPEEGVAGLTARVMANRYWYLLFGTGLCRDLTDFGGQGAPPTHPELLDTLALAFIDSGWSTKSLMRSIVLSETYQQASDYTDEMLELDPGNDYFARQGRYRLPAEFIRDNALAISGLLDRKIGGASVKPYQPAGYYRHLNFPPREYQSDEGEAQWRRGVYVHWQRQFLHPMLKAFDAPTREECTAQRPSSNTPLAAMVLLNDPSFVEAAKAFAQRILTETEVPESLTAASTDDDPETQTSLDRQRIKTAFQLAVSRQPDDFEVKTILEILHQERAHYEETPEQAQELLEVGQFEPTDEIPATEMAAWTSVARVVLNLSETTTRP